MNVTVYVYIYSGVIWFNIFLQVYLHPDVEKIVIPKFKEIVKRHNGILTENAEEATHCVYQLPNDRDEGEISQCIRPLTGNVMVMKILLNKKTLDLFIAV